jgi:DNA excision repair protein ERCC-2
MDADDQARLDTAVATGPAVPAAAPLPSTMRASGAGANHAPSGGGPVPPAGAAVYTVAVRTLCEFAAKRGDLDLRFTPAPTALQGMAGHRAVVQVRHARGAGYRPEVQLQGSHRGLVVRGRADGVDDGRELLEEIKTFRGSVDRIPDNHRALHWAQAKVYAWLLCAGNGAAAWNVALVYFDTDRQQEAPPLQQRFTADELRQHFESLCESFIGWAEREAAHRCQRDAALRTLRFAHGEFRAGQRALAEAVFVAARRGRCLMAQAPTGIGKTVGTLFPALKAMPEQALDKLFFLTAKGSGRAVAFEALQLIASGVQSDSPPGAAGGSGAAVRAPLPPRPWRVIELVAREKACEHPDAACHGDACPLARGFYDRLPDARRAALDDGRVLDRDALRDIARTHAVCPYYLAQDLVRWCDVVIGDYNHWFDLSALLHGLTLMLDWRVAVLADEAHNLVDRSRDNFSAALDSERFRGARASAPAALKRPLSRLQRSFSECAREHTADYTVLADFPPRIERALQALVDAATDLMAESPQALHGPALELYFEALHLLRLREEFDESHSLIDLALRPNTRATTRATAHGTHTTHANTGTTASATTSATTGATTNITTRAKSAPEATLCIRNVLPAPFLAPRFAAARCVVLFSATLAPMQFYADTLGLPADTAWLDVPAPFRAEQLAVRIVPTLSTRYAHRAASVEPIARLIAEQYERAPGNYLAFFSSFDYLAQAADALIECYPCLPIWRQSRRMDEAERTAFIGRFQPDGRGIGFAVLGGLFAEGVDLPGTRLIGAFIATLGLPQLNPVNEALRQRLQQRFGRGFDYTYLVPGLRKVVQAAGRVVRTPTDHGSVHLIDDRFGRPEVRALLPAWWRVEAVGPAGPGPAPR